MDQGVLKYWQNALQPYRYEDLSSPKVVMVNMYVGASSPASCKFPRRMHFVKHWYCSDEAATRHCKMRPPHLPCARRMLQRSRVLQVRKLKKAVAVWNWQFSTLLEKSSPIFRQRDMLSMPMPKFRNFAARKRASESKSPAFRNAPGFSPPRPPQPSWVFLIHTFGTVLNTWSMVGLEDGRLDPLRLCLHNGAQSFFGACHLLLHKLWVKQFCTIKDRGAMHPPINGPQNCMDEKIGGHLSSPTLELLGQRPTCQGGAKSTNFVNLNSSEALRPWPFKGELGPGQFLFCKVARLCWRLTRPKRD